MCCCPILRARSSRQIEELRDLLHQPWSDKDEGNPWPALSHLDQPSLGLDTSLLGYRALAHTVRNFHPPFSQLILLLELFKENVAPLVRIFHMPSLVQVFWNSIASLDTLDKDTEALLFTIYYAAIISLAPEQCQTLLGESRASALASTASLSNSQWPGPISSTHKVSC